MTQQPETPEDRSWAPPPPPVQDSPPPYGPPPAYGYPQAGHPQAGHPQAGYPSAGQYAGYPGTPYAAYPPVPTLYASWPARVGAALLDGVFGLPGLVLVIVGVVLMAVSSDRRGEPLGPGFGVGLTLVILGYLTVFALQLWTRVFQAGRTGQSWGKQVVGIRLVGMDGQPIGAGMAFVRDLAHVVDGFFYLGYLWPLWDTRRQTFADKICSTVVVPQEPQPR